MARVDGGIIGKGVGWPGWKQILLQQSTRGGLAAVKKDVYRCIVYFRDTGSGGDWPFLVAIDSAMRV